MEKEKKKFRLRFTIGNKILAGFFAVILLFIINATIIFLTGNNIVNEVNKSSQVYRPSKDAINNLVILVERYQKLLASWVYRQSTVDNDPDKKALTDLVNYEYPALKEDILKYKESWDVDSQKVKIDSIFSKFESIQTYGNDQITSQLSSFESYDDGVTKMMAENVLETELTVDLRTILDEISRINEAQSTTTAESEASLVESARQLRNITIILAIITISLGILFAFLLIRAITRPVNFLKNVVVKLGRGELVEEKQTKFSNDEIGEMAQAMDSLVTGLKATTLFAENIGKGSYTSDFKPLSEQDVLGNALINMRDNLSRVAQEDNKRNWSTEGLAKFGEILRTNTNDLMKLSDEIILNLVKYLRGNQGAIYIADDVEGGEEPTISMKSCYAWDKKKYLNHKIHKGEGLAGQAWQEGDTIYITEVPQNYIRITSGLGDANPTSVLIVPLKVNEEIFGIVEIASFNAFKDFEIEFVQKIGESIASTISSVKINARTQRLLVESQEMTEEMRAQEEEMRQNMEELQATQEEMQRNQSEIEGTMLAINGALAIADYDIEGKIAKINSNYLNIMGYSQNELIGEHHRLLVPKEEKTSEEYRQFWRELATGNPKRGSFKRMSRRGELVQLKSHFSPVKNRMGEIVKIMEITHFEG